MYRRRKSVSVIHIVAIAIIMVVLGSVAVRFIGFRFDFEAGSHRITPTAVDKDLWGNYKVYYKTSNLTQDADESYYYIAKGGSDLAEKVNAAILNGNEIMVFYEKYVGFKGVGSPQLAPITRIEVVSKSSTP